MSEGTESTEQNGQEPSGASTSPAGEANKPPQSQDDLPQWARDQIKDANNEAARYRVRARDAEQAAKESANAEFAQQIQSISDEKASVSAELESTSKELKKLRAVLDLDVPSNRASDYAEMVQGSTDEEIQASAQKIVELIAESSAKSDRPTDRSQGQSGRTSAAPADEFGAFILGQLN